MNWKRRLERNWGRLDMRYRLDEIVDVTMGQSPKSEYYNTEKNGYPFLQGNRTFGFKYPTFDTYTTVVTKFAKAGDVIMSVRAPVGALNITPVDMCLGRGVCALRMKNGNQSFLFYMMKNYVSHLLKRESGTVFGSVNRNDINSLEVDIPEDVEEQKRIARYLEMIDDKIELNTAINNNLPPHPCYARIAAKQRRQTPKTDECLHTDGKVSDRGGNEETAEQFLSILAA